MDTISASEIIFHPQSFGADPNGRLFEWEGCLYRAITLRQPSVYCDMFEKGVVQRLVNLGLLVGTEISPLHLDGYELILKHDRIPFVSYPFEWSARMLQDAALSFLGLSLELAKVGLTTQDANPWNMLFDGCKPIYVDFCSIVPADSSGRWLPYDEFCRFFLYPLQLMSVGYVRMTRWTLHDFYDGVPPAEFAAVFHGARLGLRPGQELTARLRHTLGRFVPRPLRVPLKQSWQLLREKTRPRPPSLIEFLERLKSEVQSIYLPTKPTNWSGYYDGFFPPLVPSESWTAKHNSVFNTLKRLRPTSILDIGSNRGWYSQVAATHGSKVVSFDVDERCVTLLYQDAKANNLSILPLVMDLRNPSPGLGLCYKWFAPATERLKCDMVLALALIHHLVFKEHLRFDQISEALNAFSKRWLLVEFIPRDDQYVKEWWSEEYVWYNLDSFCSSLGKFFHRIEVMPSHPSPRQLLLCEK
jgi:hypothetical protein